MIIKEFWDFFDKIDEKIINTDDFEKYLISFFNFYKNDLQQITNEHELLFYLNKIEYKISNVPYFFDVKIDEKIYSEVLLKNNISVIVIYINDTFFDLIKNDFDKIINVIIWCIMHEYIHIIQFEKSNYLHPLNYNARRFNQIKKIISDNIDNNYYNYYFDEPYEFMATANTLVNQLLNKYSKLVILDMLKNNEIPFLSKIKIDDYKKKRIEKYIYEYLK